MNAESVGKGTRVYIIGRVLVFVCSPSSIDQSRFSGFGRIWVSSPCGEQNANMQNAKSGQNAISEPIGSHLTMF